MQDFEVGVSERTEVLGPWRIQGAKDAELRRRRRRVDALNTSLCLFAGRSQERVHVLAQIARHEADMDASNNRVDAQRPRIVRIRWLRFER